MDASGRTIKLGAFKKFFDDWKTASAGPRMETTAAARWGEPQAFSRARLGPWSVMTVMDLAQGRA